MMGCAVLMTFLSCFRHACQMSFEPENSHPFTSVEERTYEEHLKFVASAIWVILIFIVCLILNVSPRPQKTPTRRAVVVQRLQVVRTHLFLPRLIKLPSPPGSISVWGKAQIPFTHQILHKWDKLHCYRKTCSHQSSGRRGSSAANLSAEINYPS